MLGQAYSWKGIPNLCVYLYKFTYVHLYNAHVHSLVCESQRSVSYVVFLNSLSTQPGAYPLS